MALKEKGIAVEYLSSTQTVKVKNKVLKPSCLSSAGSEVGRFHLSIVFVLFL